MKKETSYLQVPHHYLMCLNQQCSRKNTCLRQLATQAMPAETRIWNIVSPVYLNSIQDTCPYYRPLEKVRFAKGFIKLLENLPHKQMQTVITRLSGYFGRRTYYRVRKGERLLSPPEQEAILQLIKKCGIAQVQEFDTYVDDYDW